jgi:hypothetical protein
MTFISASYIAETKRAGSGGRSKGTKRNAELLTVSSNLGAKSLVSGFQRRQITVRITEQLAKKARILPGDRLDLLFDKEANLGLIKRVVTGGYSATAAGVHQDKIVSGRFYNVVIKATHYEGMPMFPKSTDCENVTITDEGILFTMPSDTEYSTKESRFVTKDDHENPVKRLHDLASRPLNELNSSERSELANLAKQY